MIGGSFHRIYHKKRSKQGSWDMVTSTLGIWLGSIGDEIYDRMRRLCFFFPEAHGTTGSAF